MLECNLSNIELIQFRHIIFLRLGDLNKKKTHHFFFFFLAKYLDFQYYIYHVYSRKP